MSEMAGTDIDRPLRIALAQINTTVGDIEGNAAKIADYIGRARDTGAQLVVFPELAINGYPPEDLLLKTHFLAAGERALEEIARGVTDMVALIGFAEHAGDVYNSLAIVADGRVQGIYRKTFLPNYGVFDEHRYFQEGDTPAIIAVEGAVIGLTVCEDIWEPGPPATDEALAGAEVIVNVSASPYHTGKGAQRERMLVQRARDSLAWVVFCNLVGGQDELVFDGYSLVIDQDGEVVARGEQFEEQLLVSDIDPTTAQRVRLRDARHRAAARARHPQVAHLGSYSAPPRHTASEIGGTRADDTKEPEAEVYGALCLGLRDYVDKNGFERVLLGLSGGIDSALTACVAVDALGSERVVCAVMPSPYSSGETQADARELAENLEVESFELPLEPIMQSFDHTLAGAFDGSRPGLAEENIQARIRGNLLMALSNKFGWLVLTTGNKSEYSVGYTTLYGDMAGGFGVLKDVPKTWVYRLAKYRNSPLTGPIPESIIQRPPSAELKAGQRDDDTLPPYDMLDVILEAYVEEDQGREQLIRRGLPEQVVDQVIAMVDRAEYKRRQAPPGIKISPRAFGRDRRLPITNRFRG
jgi:NAD+ synthase (glutamine-hydrolysing)